MRIRTRKDFGQLVKEYRRKKGLTQAQLAEAVGVSRRWVVQVEQAKTSADLGTVFQALRALGAEMHIRPRLVTAAAAEINEIVDATRGRQR